MGSSENGYQVKAEMVPSSHSNMWNYGVSISTPERTYMFTCESELERESWLDMFKKVISIPMTVREYAGKTTLIAFNLFYSGICM